MHQAEWTLGQTLCEKSLRGEGEVEGTQRKGGGEVKSLIMSLLLFYKNY
jgi:hypothetical protein